MKDQDFKRIPCKHYIEDISKAPVFSDLYLQAMKKRVKDLDLVPDRHRCAHCLKFLARDSTKVAEDEVTQLKICPGCLVTLYCYVGDCQEKHAAVHKWFCKPFRNVRKEEIAEEYNLVGSTLSKDGTFVGKILGKKEQDKLDSLHKIHLFVQGILSLNRYALAKFKEHNFECILGNPFVDVRAKAAQYLTREVCISALFLGDWERVNFTAKIELMRNAQYRFNLGNIPVPEHLEKCGVNDNIIEALKKSKLLNTSYFTQEQIWFAYHYADYLLMAAIVKINIIEDMKWQLLQHNLHFHKTRLRKKLFHCPRILKCITLYILGKDVNAFEKDITEQEKHLYDIFQALDNVKAGDRAIGSTYLHDLLADSTKKFSADDKVWSEVKKARKVGKYVLQTNFIWNFYFSVNSIAKKYVKAFYEK